MTYNCPKCGKKMHPGSKAGSGKVRWTCEGRVNGKQIKCYQTTDPTKPLRGRAPPPVVFNRALRKRRRMRFLVTAAQNQTAVHVDFLRTLLTYCKFTGAELIVVPLLYRGQPEWAPELLPYMFNQRLWMADKVVALCDIKTSITAVNPLTGYEALTHGESGIIAHPKLALTTVPTPQNTLPKILATTGAVTVDNYTDTRAGALGDFHHTLGAALVEIDGDRYYIRQINASKRTGEFIDKHQRFGPNSVVSAERAEAMVMGDVHRDFLDRKAWEATQEQFKLLRPKRKVWHDLSDTYAASPHHGQNALIALAKIRAERGDVRGEVERAVQFVIDNTESDEESIIVYSNHPEMLRRWVINTDPRTQPANIQFWCKLMDYMAENAKLGPGGAEYPDPFVYWGRRMTEGLPNIKFLEQDESYLVGIEGNGRGGIELGMHGHDGPNGARGSRRNLRRIGVKSIIGHSHTPGIDEGCYQVGTLCALRQEYHRGPGSSMHANAVLYANFKRSLLMINEGHWRL